jgi:DNA polymerase-3 subunit epsilon
MREIIVDTETTGLDPASGHRLVEIACVEMINLVQTREYFHAYIDPERDVPTEAFKIHGLATEFLRGKPRFAAVASQFLEFIGDSRLVIHNAEFDIKFINFELGRVGLAPIEMSRVVDTLALARKRHPNASNSLDALCVRYRVNNSKRTKHGALLDSELLAEVYAELMGGRQTSMSLAVSAAKKVAAAKVREVRRDREKVLPSRLAPAECAAHEQLIAELKSSAIWLDYREKLGLAGSE